MTINLACQNIMWDHMLELIKDNNLQESLRNACGTEVLSSVGCSAMGQTGVLLSCMIDNREKIEDGPCQTFIQRLEWVAFSDFRIITHFTNDCEKDIKEKKCGRLRTEKVCGYYIIVGQVVFCIVIPCYLVGRMLVTVYRATHCRTQMTMITTPLHESLKAQT